MRQTAITSDPNAMFLISQVVEAAIADAHVYGVALPGDENAARQFLVTRVVRAIEHGETDLKKLRELALMPSLP